MINNILLPKKYPIPPSLPLFLILNFYLLSFIFYFLFFLPLSRFIIFPIPPNSNFAAYY